MMLRSVRYAWALAGALSAANAGAAAATAPPLTLRDVRALVSFQDPQIAPDGKTIAVVVRTQDFAKDRFRSQIVLIDIATRKRTAVTRIADAASAPRWSPTGDRLAFLAKPLESNDAKAPTGGMDQIHVVTVGSGAPQTVTSVKGGIEGYSWSRDGRAFAYVTPDAAPNQQQLDAKDNGFEIGDNEWTAQAAPRPKHLWTVGAAGGAPIRRTQGAWSVSSDPVWSPDGKRIFFERFPSAYSQHYAARRLAVVALASGQVAPVGPAARSTGIFFSRSGRRSAYSSADPASFSQREIRVTAADGSRVERVTQALNRDVDFATFTPNGRELVVAAADGTRDRLFRVRIANGAVEPLALGDVNISGGVSQAPNGTLAFIGVSPSRGDEVYALRSGERAPRRLTSDNAWIATRGLAAMRALTWRSADGFRVDGVLTEPLGGVVRGRKYPLVLVIHGGPTSASTTSWDALDQLLAARGWFVFEPNYRGSNNLGRRFAQATVPHITSAPAKDVMDGLSAVLQGAPIDQRRIGVSGWSEGGLLTSWLIAHDTRWKAAMSGAAVNDWLMYADMTDAQDFTPYFLSRDSPWVSDAARALYLSESPLTYAHNVKTPTLIMTDAGDQRVPAPQSYAFFHAIRATGTPVRMVIFPVDGHYPTDPVRREDVMRRWVEWFAQQL